MTNILIINDNYDNSDSDDEFVPFPQSFAYCVSNLITNKNKKINSKKSRDVKSSYVTCGGYKVSINK